MGDEYDEDEEEEKKNMNVKIIIYDLKTHIHIIHNFLLACHKNYLINFMF